MSDGKNNPVLYQKSLVLSMILAFEAKKKPPGVKPGAASV